MAQISPGPLSKAHASLAGPGKCSSCHTFGTGTPQLKCLGCHEEIRRELSARHGFHFRVVKRGGHGGDNCAPCHAEHAGVNFNIVRWETSAAEFDHRRTGYPLEGKHAGLACARCHNANHVPRQERALIRVKDLNHTYMGLSAGCTTCHADEHRGQLGADCSRCHTLQAWKPASGFDHGKARYVLTGMHARVACQQCHKPVADAAKPYVRYTDLPFQACSDCHRDPHRGAFQAPCQSCHVTTGWKSVNVSAGFDHGKTKYPLLGLHANVSCEKCHKTDDFKATVAHARCADCHTPDPHNGQFGTQDCANCHSESGFKMTSFDVQRHQQTRYRLLGRHAAVECAKCHIPAGTQTVYRLKFDACLDCHKDVHRGQFTANFASACDACHTVEGFRPSTFTLARHQHTKFQLAGAHGATACVECHKPSPGEDPIASVRYHFGSLACNVCHEDPHQGQFKDTAFKGCTTCHNVRSWKDVSAFNHDTTKFKLLGAHRSITCMECHKPVNFGRTVRNVSFSGAPSSCEGCHEDVHAGQFTVSGKALNCSSCHGMVAWKPSLFDHEKQSRFSLKGAHARVPCGDCHKPTAVTSGGRPMPVYRGTPSRCADCHSGPA